MHLWYRLFALFALLASFASAATEVPSVSKQIADASLPSVGATSSYGLKDYFSYTSVTGKIYQFESNLGSFNAVLLESDAPKTVANFLNYLNNGSYSNLIVHRSVPDFVIQTGGFTLKGTEVATVTAGDAIVNEYKISNTRGTLAMAKTSSGPDTATCQWFINLADNSTNLDNQNGGFTVFGRVLGNGMVVADAIAALDIYNASATIGSDFSALPVTDLPVVPSHLVVISSIKEASIYPDSDSTPSIVKFSAASSNTAAVSTSVSGNQLTITRVGAGSATITVTETDTNGQTASQSFSVGAIDSSPVFDTNPLGVSLGAGDTLALYASATGQPAPTYQWYKDGVAISGATDTSYIVTGVTTASAGSYHVVATNAQGSTKSASATVTVQSSASTSILAALSVRTALAANSRLMIGFVTSGSRDLLVTGIGPALAKALPSSYMADPKLELYNSSSTLIDSNDDWDFSLSDTVTRVRGNGLEIGSRDAALYKTLNGAYTAHVFSAAAGIALAEVYDGGSGYDGRLTAISARSPISTGDSILIGGFVITGSTAKTVLLRGLGPALDSSIGNRLADPYLELYNSSGALIARNYDWSSSLNDAIKRTFGGALTAGSKDAALMITLPPGAYTVQVKGTNNTTGEGMVEIYEAK